MAANEIDLRHTRRQLLALLRPETSFFQAALIYGVSIGLLTLAVPIAVQTLINTVANIGSSQMITYLSLILFMTLLASGLLSGMRTWIMERYERRAYARLSAELSMTAMGAHPDYFAGARNYDITQRYFDIMILQKNVPALLINGFALVLQMLVGLTLVSFYHPYFLAFNLVLVGLIIAIWKLWGRGAIITAIELSRAKYETAKWLTGLAAANDFFKSARHMDYAQRITDNLANQYIDSHEKHFSFTFSQTLMFLLLYALASASLLGVGGWLVLLGELSIGQLVAAELILSAIFFGLSQFAGYLRLYYELYGAADEIGLALEVPQENASSNYKLKEPTSSSLEFDQVVAHAKQCPQTISFRIEANEKAFIHSPHVALLYELTRLIKYHRQPEKGRILLGEHEVADFEPSELRHQIIVIDRSLIVECTIRDYLRIASPDATSTEIREILSGLGVWSSIEQLPKGLDTVLTPLGYPLYTSEFLLVKMAAALLARPRVIILSHYCKLIPENLLSQALEYLATQDCSVLFFTQDEDRNEFPRHIHVGQPCPPAGLQEDV